MSENDMNSTSRTNWERLDALSDEQIDTSDVPALTDEFFAKAEWRTPAALKEPTVSVELRVAPETLAWFQSQGGDYQERMQAVLRRYVETRRAA